MSEAFCLAALLGMIVVYVIAPMMTIVFGVLLVGIRWLSLKAEEADLEAETLLLRRLSLAGICIFGVVSLVAWLPYGLKKIM